MKLVLFSKHFAGEDVPKLAARANKLGLDGYDLAVRPGQAVNPENALTALPEAVSFFKKEGLAIPMVTARGNLLSPEDDDVRPLLKAMDKADVRLLKLGYFHLKRFQPFDYWKEVDAARKILAKWAKLGAEYRIRICYHTHSAHKGEHLYLGSNASGLMHLLEGQDSVNLGAYLDAGHLEAEGEPFDFAVPITGKYFSMLAVKDVRIEKVGEERKAHWMPAGQGQVDWNNVFRTLGNEGFDGTISIHAEYEVSGNETFESQLPKEVAFFRDKVKKFLK
ncbi:MAG: sugar phosphate isomerase/epimerase [Spirochaetia bacterium]|nr:sugar phosphate isomerase/epimerase [Spirochaetia bacterium]